MKRLLSIIVSCSVLFTFSISFAGEAAAVEAAAAETADADKTQITPPPQAALTTQYNPTSLAPQAQQEAPASTEPEMYDVTLTKAAAAPQLVYTGSKSKVDLTNKDKGYVRASYLNTTKKVLKIKIIKLENGKEQGSYVYDLNSNAQYESYPLQMGNGNYCIKVLENVSGNSYAVVQAQNFTVKLSSANDPYLVSTQLINYSSTSKAVTKAAALCKGQSTDLKKVTAIYQYIVKNITYDSKKASDVTAGKLNGYVPNVDTILSSKKGICFDYSSLMGAMLRSQGIPTKLVMGYVAPNNVYHAWNEVYIKNVGWVKINSQVYFDGKSYARMDSTFAAGNSKGTKTEFIGNGKNYSKKYEY